MNKKELESELEKSGKKNDKIMGLVFVLGLAVASLGYIKYDIYSIRSRVGKCFKTLYGNLVKINRVIDGGAGFYYEGPKIRTYSFGPDVIGFDSKILSENIMSKINCSIIDTIIIKSEIEKHIEESDKRLKKLEKIKGE